MHYTVAVSRQQVAMGASGGVAAGAYLGSSHPPGCGRLSSDIQVASRPSPVGRMATVAADVLRRLSSKWAPGNRFGSDWTGCSVDRLGGSSVHRLDPLSRVGRLAEGAARPEHPPWTAGTADDFGFWSFNR